MAELAHLFSPKSDPDTFIITASLDLDVYGFSLPFDKHSWQHVGTIELDAMKLRRYAYDPIDIIQSLSAFGYYTVTSQIYRALKNKK